MAPAWPHHPDVHAQPFLLGFLSSHASLASSSPPNASHAVRPHHHSPSPLARPALTSHSPCTSEQFCLPRETSGQPDYSASFLLLSCSHTTSTPVSHTNLHLHKASWFSLFARRPTPATRITSRPSSQLQADYSTPKPSKDSRAPRYCLPPCSSHSPLCTPHPYRDKLAHLHHIIPTNPRPASTFSMHKCQLPPMSRGACGQP